MKIPYQAFDAQIVEPRTGILLPIGQKLVRAINELIDRTGGITGGSVPLPNYVVADLPAGQRTGSLAYCTDETGGEVPVFVDSAGAWRRVTDRTVAS